MVIFHCNVSLPEGIFSDLFEIPVPCRSDLLKSERQKTKSGKLSKSFIAGGIHRNMLLMENIRLTTWDV